MGDRDAQTELRRADLADDPIEQFRRWYEEVAEVVEGQATAVTLSTVGQDGAPSARVVLLKGYDADGFIFYTNYGSPKASDIAVHNTVCLNFWWERLMRQVRISGTAERVSMAESEAYFATRPRGSQLGAWASQQSEPLASRDILEKRFAEVEARFENDPIPCPPHWGGYRVRPAAMEFWQGRSDRLHDRFRYRRNAEGVWEVERLNP